MIEQGIPMVGTTVSHYKILKKLGGGGMGIVYQAQDLKLDRPVALKFLPPELTGDPEARHRFIHEAKAASSLQHDNIGVIHDIDETQNGPADAIPPRSQMFIVMEYYEGETLKEKISRGPLTVDQSIDVAIQIARGLSEAHGRGIVHRDIKPANVMVTRSGTAKIVDFGLAILLGMTRLTTGCKRVGTVHYMSPEQARSESVDHRTDVWALGVLLYEMLAGRPPFESTYDEALVYSILNTDPPPVSSIRKDAPPLLDEIIGRALAKDPALRYQHVEEMLNDLTRLKGPETGSTVRVRPPLSLASLNPRRKWQIGVATAILVVGSIAARTLIWNHSYQPVGSTGKLKIGLFPLRNATGKVECNEWAARIRESLLPAAISGSNDISLLSTSLFAGPATVPVDSPGTGRKDWYDEATRAGADFVLDGSILNEDSMYTLQINLVEPGSANLRHTAMAAFSGSSQLDRAVSIAARRILYFLDIEVLHPDGDLRAWIPRRQIDVSAEQAFAEAAEIMYTGETGGSRFLRKAIELDSTFISPRVWLVSILVNEGRRDEARRHYDVLLSLASTASPFEEAIIEYAGGCINGNARVMVHGLEKALLFAPNNRIILLNLGAEKISLGDFEGAVRDLDGVVASRMYHPPLYPEYAGALIRLKRFDDARKALAIGMNLKPVDPDTYGLLAAFAWKDGDSAAAERYEGLYADRLSDFGISRNDALHNIGCHLLEMEDYDLAKVFLQKALAFKPGFAETHLCLAEACEASGDTAEAVRQARSALALDSRAARAYSILGKISDDHGDTKRAVYYYRKYLSADSVSVSAGKAERRLLALTSTQR
jgi:serine/threonine protein kinase/Flp pilus assembly protein TadD